MTHFLQWAPPPKGSTIFPNRAISCPSRHDPAWPAGPLESRTCGCHNSLLSPAKSHLLNLSKQCHQVMSKCANAQDWRTIPIWTTEASILASVGLGLSSGFFEDSLTQQCHSERRQQTTFRWEFSSWFVQVKLLSDSHLSAWGLLFPSSLPHVLWVSRGLPVFQSLGQSLFVLILMLSFTGSQQMPFVAHHLMWEALDYLSLWPLPCQHQLQGPSPPTKL